MKKLFVVNVGEGRQNPRKTLECRKIGNYTDDEGVRWECFTPTGLTLSVWVRMEHPGRRPQFLYDPGGGFRRNLERQEMERQESHACNDTVTDS